MGERRVDAVWNLLFSRMRVIPATMMDMFGQRAALGCVCVGTDEQHQHKVHQVA